MTVRHASRTGRSEFQVKFKLGPVGVENADPARLRDRPVSDLESVTVIVPGTVRHPFIDLLYGSLDL